ncbi:MAG: hypothetical protein ABI867_11340 [Kofleriaceae bacterium]
MSRRGLVLALAALGACGLRASLSAVSYTNVSCDRCHMRHVPVGFPVVILLDYPKGEEDQEPTLHQTTTCNLRCRVEERFTESDGVGIVTVTPEEPGTLRLAVTMHDVVKSRSFELGPIDVVVPTRVELACQTRHGVGDYVPCADDRIEDGDDVRVEVQVWAGDLRLDAAAPALVVNGTTVPELHRTSPRWESKPWLCVQALAASETGTTLACVAHDVPASGNHTFVARLGALEAHLEVAFGARRPKPVE